MNIFRIKLFSCLENLNAHPLIERVQTKRYRVYSLYSGIKKKIKIKNV